MYSTSPDYPSGLVLADCRWASGDSTPLHAACDEAQHLVPLSNKWGICLDMGCALSVVKVALSLAKVTALDMILGRL